jgi:hypothetical protein
MRLVQLIALWLLATLPVSAALDVRNPRWGFGGKPVLGTFNILSVEVRNPGGGVASEVLTLKTEGGGASSAAYHHPVTLSPGQTRWVQFNVYIGNYKPDFELWWGEGQTLPIEDARGEKNSAPPAVVVLADPDAVRASRFPVFPEDMFPATVSATDGLHAVLLDHQPHFRAASQTDAFLDWVRLGGIVHVVPGPSGTLPTFEGKLAVLNVAGSPERVETGWVVKHSVTVAEASDKLLENAGFPAPTEPSGNARPDPNQQYYRNNSDGAADSSFFETLAMVTRPKIAWWLIYLLTVVYVVVIGPVFFILRRRDYRVLLLGFLGTVAMFAWIFTVIGRRGYGESQVCHSLAIARVMGGGRYDVTHWSHAFATSGNTYHFSYPGASQLYAAVGQPGEKVRGSINLGGDASFDADIPLFSFRNFLHRGVMTGDDVAATAVSIPQADPSRQFDLWRDGFKMTLAGEVPGEVISAAVQVGKYFLPAQISGREVKIYSYSSNSGVGVLRPNGSDNSDRYYRYYGYGRSPEEALSALRSDGADLAQRALAEPADHARGLGRPMGKNTLRLYIYAAAPRAFRMAGTEFAAGRNFILYVQDLAMPGGKSPL